MIELETAMIDSDNQRMRQNVTTFFRLLFLDRKILLALVLSLTTEILVLSQP